MEHIWVKYDISLSAYYSRPVIYQQEGNSQGKKITFWSKKQSITDYLL